MSALTLRGLAKAYSDGIVDRKQYVRERHQLIDDITSGEVELIPYEPSATPSIPDGERTFSGGAATLEPVLINTEAPRPRRASSKLPLIITAILTITAVAVIGWFKLAPKRASFIPAPTDVNPTITSYNQPNPAEKLLRDFLEKNQWQNARIGEFLEDWRRLDMDARRVLVDSPTVHRAIDVIYQKFLEEKALLELGDRTEVLAAQRRMLDLATEISPNNERIKRLENEWRETQAAVPGEPPQASQAAGNRTIAADSNRLNAGPNVVAANESNAVKLETVQDKSMDRLDPKRPPLEQSLAMVPSDKPNNPSIITPQPELAPQEDAIVAATVASEDVEKQAINAELPAASATPVEDLPVAIGAAVDEHIDEQSMPEARAVKKSGCRAELAKQRRPYCRDAITDQLKGPQLVVLPAGQVAIGGRNAEELPRRVITIDHPFALGIYEISAGEFSAFCTATKTNCPTQPWSDPKLPMVNVTWTMATKYTRWLSETTGATYRLPSEAEWEYAARAGTDTPYPFGKEVLPTHARFSFRGAETMPLASDDRSVNRNSYRLYHMIGNVREWVLDVWHENHAGAPLDGSARTGSSDEYVVRGGAFSDGAEQIRSASRLPLAAQLGDAKTGFRILREVD